MYLPRGRLSSLPMYAKVTIRSTTATEPAENMETHRSPSMSTVSQQTSALTCAH